MWWPYPRADGALSPQALFALSSMLRHFPYAQQQFLKLGGLQVLRSLFRQKGMEPLHVRVVTLLYDLMVEKVRSGTGRALPKGAMEHPVGEDEEGPIQHRCWSWLGWGPPAHGPTQVPVRAQRELKSLFCIKPPSLFHPRVFN